MRQRWNMLAKEEVVADEHVFSAFVVAVAIFAGMVIYAIKLLGG